MGRLSRTQSPTPQSPTPNPQLVLARVAGVLQDAILVDMAGQSHAARQAASCLLSPETGDTVLCSLSRLGVHVLHVLERDRTDSATLSAPGVQRLVLDQAAIDIQTRDLNATATRARARIDRLHLFSRLVSVVVGGLDLVADRLKRVAGHETTSVTDSVRTVRNTDTLRAGHILHEASEVMSMRSHITVIERARRCAGEWRTDQHGMNVSQVLSAAEGHLAEGRDAAAKQLFTEALEQPAGAVRAMAGLGKLALREGDAETAHNNCSATP